jgi:hypothetical protein
MGYDVQQALGEHDVDVDTIALEEKGMDLIVHVRVRFKDGEIGNKDLYPIKSEKSAQMTRKVLRAMGFDMDTRDLGEIDKNPALLKGAKVRAVVEENEYNGNITHRISFINAIPKPPSGNLLKAATAKLRNAKNDNAEEAL